MPATLLFNSNIRAWTWLKAQAAQELSVAGRNAPGVAANGLPATLCSNRLEPACVMNSGEMLRPSHMTKTRPQSIRYAPSACTAAIVSGTGVGRIILRQHRRYFRPCILSGSL